MADVHAREAPAGAFRNVFMEIAEKADILLIGGDLTQFGLPSEAENLANDLRDIKIPKLAVLGNHDYDSGNSVEIKKIFREAGVIFLDDEIFTLGHVGFAGVKGFGGGFDSHMVTAFGEDATKNFVAEAVNEALRLENHLASLSSEKIVVLLHYSPILETIKNEQSEIAAFLGSSRFAEVIDRFNVAAIFHGHAHHGPHHGKTAKGAPVYNVALDVLKRHTPDQPYVLITL